jgi:hypothetical protein
MTCSPSTGSGFIFFRPEPTNEKVGKAFLSTNKHVIPPEGKECGLSMRASVTDPKGTITLKTVIIPVVDATGKYLDTVRLHREGDVAVINITPQVAANGLLTDFVPTSLLGTKERLKQNGGALVGDEIYMIGYPAGLFDQRNSFPIWRIGIIATSPLLGYVFPNEVQKAFQLPAFLDGFLIDAHVYPGSSGSAIVIKPQAMSFDSPGGIFVGGPSSLTYVIGLISGSIPYGDFDGRFPARIGIGVVQSADTVNDTIEAFFKK